MPTHIRRSPTICPTGERNGAHMPVRTADLLERPAGTPGRRAWEGPRSMDFGMIGCVRLKFLRPRNWRPERVAIVCSPAGFKAGLEWKSQGHRADS